MLKVNLVIALVTVLTIGGILYACNSSQVKDISKPPILTQTQMIERGNYLVSSIGCDDCHSPKRMGEHGPEIIPELRLSGYPADRPIQKPDSNAMKGGYMLFGPDLTLAIGPWGMSFSANITSDATGIGNWTEHNFITAMRTGKMKGLENNRSMLPPMPWFNFKNLTDEDLKSIFAYLKSTSPVVNLVPAPKQVADIK
ncbi:MAG: c-type cytochrome [Flavisolibacter sp.]|nr:c-type cytochrome [Flavisolibacter sp.]